MFNVYKWGLENKLIIKEGGFFKIAESGKIAEYYDNL